AFAFSHNSGNPVIPRHATSQFRLRLSMTNGEEFGSEESCGVFTPQGVRLIGVSGMLGRLFAWVCGCDNGADGFLVEAFEAAPPLEGFQVAADRAFSKKTSELFFGNQPFAPQ